MRRASSCAKPSGRAAYPYLDDQDLEFSRVFVTAYPRVGRPRGTRQAAASREDPVTERVCFVDVATCRGQADILFLRLEAHLRALMPRATIEHVGSTSLPDGLTKGDLDVQVRVGADDFDRACEILEELYEPNPGGFTEAGRSFKDDSTDPPLGLHVTIIDGPSDIQHRQRDLLRMHPDLRREYDEVKRQFHGGEMTAYREAKDAFFTRIEPLWRGPG